MNEKLKKMTFGNHHWNNIALDDFKYKYGSLDLILSLENKDEIKLVFDWIYSFRLTDEGDLLKMQEEQNGEMLTGIYVIDDSSYLKWFHEQSFCIHENESILHYLIVTVDDVVDVLSSVAPLLVKY